LSFWLYASDYILLILIFSSKVVGHLVKWNQPPGVSTEYKKIVIICWCI